MGDMTAGQVRQEMLHQLVTVVEGSSWARPDPPEKVWDEYMDRVLLLKEERALLRDTLALLLAAPHHMENTAFAWRVLREVDKPFA